MAQWGDPHSGPRFINAFRWMCQDMNSFLCVQVDKVAPLDAPAPMAGKKIWVSTAGFVGGSGLGPAQTICNNEKPAGVASSKPLLANNNTAASSLVAMDTLYVRPDGIPVGTGADLVADKLRSAPWVHADGTAFPFTFGVWHGSGRFNRPGTNGETCMNWMSGAAGDNGINGPVSTKDFWNMNGVLRCDAMQQIYCIEE